MPCSYLIYLTVRPGVNDEVTSDVLLKVSRETTEARFYEYFARELPVGMVPECFNALSGSNGSHLLLRDYSSTHEPREYGPDSPWPDTTSMDDSMQVAETFACIHALSWADWDLSLGTPSTKRSLPEGIVRVGAEAMLATEDIEGAFGYSQEVTGTFLKKMAGMLTEEEADQYLLVARGVNSLLQDRVVSGRHLCVTRQDAKPENVLYPRCVDDRPIVVDFGAQYLWFGPNDLAVHLNRFEPSFRREVGMDLLRHDKGAQWVALRRRC